MSRLILRLWLACALLCAQQAALGHALAHAGKLDGSPEQQLCNYHGALDAVAGGVDAPVASAVVAESVRTPYHFTAAAAAQLRARAPASRGPPAVS